MRSHTERTELVGGKHTPIIMDDWKVNVHNHDSTAAGYRRYHRHGEDWYSVKIKGGTINTPEHRWICGECEDPVPDEMEGYINLMRWSGT